MELNKLQNLTWKQVDELEREKTLAIVLTGSMEQHGPHLPLGQDTFVAQHLADEALKKVGDRIKYVVLPPLPIGQSPEHMDFPGTLTFSAETYLNVILDVCESLANHGFKKILFINGHGGNTSIISAASFDARVRFGVEVYLFSVWSIVPFLSEEVIKREASRTDLHGGELETSIMLAIDPHLVHMEWGVDEVNLKYDQGEFVTFLGPVTLNWNSMHDVAPSGISGQASFGTAEKGDKIIEYLVNILSKALVEIVEKW